MANPLRYEQLSDLGLLRVRGKDRQSFLQGQLTQDLLKLDASHSLLAGWNNPKGRLLAIFQLFSRDQEILLLMPRSLLTGVAQRLTMFVLRADVSIEQTSLTTFGLLDLAKDSDLELGGLRLPPMTGASVSDEKLLLARSPGETSRALVVGDESALLTLLATAGEAAPTNSWQRAEIAAGLPSIGPATSEAFVPQMLNLDLLSAISFTKGCYVGQEVVARTQNLGRIKRRMFRFRTGSSAELAEGDTLQDPAGESAGKVVSSVRVDGKQELLAVVPLSQLNSRLMSSDGTELERLELPYAVPDPD